MSKTRGFTLVELVAVITILGVVGIGAVSFIRYGIDTYNLVSSREQVLSDSRFVVERLNRELRSAVPASVRLSCDLDDATALQGCHRNLPQCLEFVPIAASGSYVLVPVTPVASPGAIVIEPWNGYSHARGDRLLVYPQNETDVYGAYASDQPWVEITGWTQNPDLGWTPDDESITATLGFAGNHRFPAASPAKRYFIAREPVSFCIEGSQLKRYQGYGFNGTQPLPDDGLDNGVLMAENLVSMAPFHYAADTYRRNALIHSLLEFESEQGERVLFNNEVHLANAP